tara:strand:+ start:232 stop:975 length:744 start_codon:yes stop_codon:yes gene_type:complete
MNIQKFFIGLLVVTFSLSIFADHHKGDGMKNKGAKKGMIAKKMVESGYKGRDPFLKMVKKHMADDGYQYPSRFVGFGFYYDPNGDQPDVVISTVEGSSASEAMKVGDEVLSINGVKDWRNTDPEATKVGDVWNVKVKRDGKEVDLEMARTVVQPRTDKATFVENIEGADAEQWGSSLIEYRMIDVAVGKEVAYVLHWRKDLDEESGVEAETYIVTRVGFDESGKVNFIGALSEDELLLRQTGWSITR